MILDQPYPETGPRYVLAVRGSRCNPNLNRGNPIPASKEELALTPERFPQVTGFLDPGTQIVFRKASYQYGPEQRLYIYGEVTSGAFRGTQVILEAVSSFRFENPSLRSGHQFSINQNCLKAE